MRDNAWQTRLVAVLSDEKYKTYQRGETDCAMLVADCCVALCGKDPAAEYRGKYSDLKGALSALKEYGTITDALDRHFERVDPAFAQRGDAVMMSDEMAVGIMWAGRVWTAEERKGICATGAEITVAWRVE